MSGAETEPEPESEPEADAESEPEPETEPEADAESEPEPESEPEADAESEPETEPEPEAETGTETEPPSGDGQEADFHDMREPRIEKVVVHMGVGQGGRELGNAEDILEDVTGQRSVRTQAKRTIQEFGIREGDPIGAKVTLRAEDAREFLETALPLADLSVDQFDETGNFSFGVAEHTDFPSQDYDPTVGIYGLDVTVALVRPGYRVAKRDQVTRSIPRSHRMTPGDAVAFLEREFDVEVSG